MLIIALALATSAISPEAEALGVRLARTGTLATLLPMIVAKDTEELVASQNALSNADKVQLRAIATSQAKTQIDRLMAAEGHAYASNLSLTDLKALVAFHEKDVSVRFRAALPTIIATTMKGAAGVDFKKEALAEFCLKTGKGCQAK